MCLAGRGCSLSEFVGGCTTVGRGSSWAIRRRASVALFTQRSSRGGVWLRLNPQRFDLRSYLMGLHRSHRPVVVTFPTRLGREARAFRLPLPSVAVGVSRASEVTLPSPHWTPADLRRPAWLAASPLLLVGPLRNGMVRACGSERTWQDRRCSSGPIRCGGVSCA